MLAELPSSDVQLALASLPAAECERHPGRIDLRAPPPKESGYVEYGLFRCGGSRRCIHAAQVCNGFPECPDHSDEWKSACQALSMYYASLLTATVVGTSDQQAASRSRSSAPLATASPRVSQPCVTIGGQDPLRSCLLPFRYRGMKFTQCALDDAIDGHAWCPTALDEAGNYYSWARWGICGPGCAAETGRRLQHDGCTMSHVSGAGHKSNRDGGEDGSSSNAPQARLDHIGNAANQLQDFHGQLPAHCAPPPSPPPTPPLPPASPPTWPPSTPPSSLLFSWRSQDGALHIRATLVVLALLLVMRVACSTWRMEQCQWAYFTQEHLSADEEEQLRNHMAYKEGRQD